MVESGGLLNRVTLPLRTSEFLKLYASDVTFTSRSPSPKSPFLGKLWGSGWGKVGGGFSLVYTPWIFRVFWEGVPYAYFPSTFAYPIYALVGREAGPEDRHHIRSTNYWIGSVIYVY